ncbi:MAG: flagellar protein FliT [Pseudomonadota bacterium]
MKKIIGAYENAWALTQQMLEAAKQSDWDKLVELEQRRAKVIEQIEELDAGVVSGTWRQRKRELLHNIIAGDEEIRTLTRDWMRELREVLNSIDTEQKLNRTYGSG